MSRLRVLFDRDAGAAAGLALDDALTQCTEHEPVLRCYTYRDHAVLVGRYQRAAAELDLGAVERLGLALGRRPTGGGTILMGAAQLGVALVVPERAAPARALLTSFGGLVADALARLGIRACLAGKNDLLVDGRKIAGLGIYRPARGGTLCHASILADLDHELLLGVLRPPPPKLADKRARLLARSVVTVTELRGESWRGSDLAAIVADAAAKSLGSSRWQTDTPHRDELDLAAELERTQYANPTWVHGGAGVASTCARVTLRTTLGTVELALDLRGGTVCAVQLSGDFVEPDDRLVALTRALRFEPADPSVLCSIAEQTLGPLARPAHLAASFHEGLGPLAAPHRLGSCLLPERIAHDHIESAHVASTPDPA